MSVPLASCSHKQRNLKYVDEQDSNRGKQLIPGGKLESPLPIYGGRCGLVVKA